MRPFFLIWAGQLVSIIGSGLTSFTVGVWVYQRTGSATAFSVALLCVTLPAVLISPIAGVVVDRMDRRRVMMLADTGAALGTAALLALWSSGRLELWHVYLITAFSTTCGVFQGPAYLASISLLVPKDQLGRASGLSQLAQAFGEVVCPIAAGALFLAIGAPGIFIIDLATFVVALATMAAVRIPKPPASPEGRAHGSALRDALLGFRHVVSVPSLLGLLLFAAALNYTMGVTRAALTPLVLTIGTPAALGTVASVAGVGMMVGSAVMGIFGDRRRGVPWMLAFGLLYAGLLFGLGSRASLGLVTALVFGLFLCIPNVGGRVQILWQRKVHPSLQGRIFAMRGMVAAASMALAIVTTGPLIDRVFEPLRAGYGAALMLSASGIFMAVAVLVAWVHPRIRRVEEEVPDAMGNEA